MTRVNISTLKANLSAYVRKAHRGQTVVVLDRDHAVARLMPLEDIEEGWVASAPKPGAASWREIPLPPRHEPVLDVVRMLREDRDRR
jgi:prevent-host-death family protein